MGLLEALGTNKENDAQYPGWTFICISRRANAE